ncbi:hypothetical protein, partial [Pseudomonas viridiflava]|uniref:hypothetical protein n=1 Tax=Pseudomonas viridiflava TaxID=33069 RepID=UPI0013E01FD5
MPQVAKAANHEHRISDDCGTLRSGIIHGPPASLQPSPPVALHRRLVIGAKLRMEQAVENVLPQVSAETFPERHQVFPHKTLSWLSDMAHLLDRHDQHGIL